MSGTMMLNYNKKYEQLLNTLAMNSICPTLVMALIVSMGENELYEKLTIIGDSLNQSEFKLVNSCLDDFNRTDLNFLQKSAENNKKILSQAMLLHELYSYLLLATVLSELLVYFYHRWKFHSGGA